MIPYRVKAGIFVENNSRLTGDISTDGLYQEPTLSVGFYLFYKCIEVGEFEDLFFFFVDVEVHK
jgi:hypothetical protein